MMAMHKHMCLLSYMGGFTYSNTYVHVRMYSNTPTDIR
jgi:hypothetical protein